MTRSLTPAAAAAVATITPPPSHKILATHRNVSLLLRRDVLVGTAFGLTINVVGDKNAEAAARRPPPPPPTEKEKKDPNVSGVLAKVLASKKRKEAMKESIAKLREKGKAINEPSPAPE
ncbi:hypothetical protein HanXRQr2_Chr02g0086391 [Helianthus annuus]|uniref:Uncharacterized protein n=1 Tax=Helianthus annuus TaxID=4232 RepID=A0A251VKQ8_HELAN|nr:uncharacterized protein LOC110927329 [Helianthus annuus]KAF5820228.1 hypothetical protein HanXRQr2_Chr02g0086391 [Helianthus annuus]KAJ0620295.1 hypothetical protein HanHA89_Chr02g0080681 [Helianthus annuus]